MVSAISTSLGSSVSSALSVVTRGNRLAISGPASATEVARLALSKLYYGLKRGQESRSSSGRGGCPARLGRALPTTEPNLWREMPRSALSKRRIDGALAGAKSATSGVARERARCSGLDPAGHRARLYLAVAAAVDL